MIGLWKARPWRTPSNFFPTSVRYRRPGVKIDLGGIAKGFAVDRAVDVLQEHGLTRGLVNAGGDLAAFGPYLDLIYLRNPTSAHRLLCQVEISNAAPASSGRGR